MTFLIKCVPVCLTFGAVVIIMALYIWIFAYTGMDRRVNGRQQIKRIAAALAASVFAVSVSFVISYFDIYENDGIRGIFRVFFDIELYNGIFISFFAVTVEIAAFRVILKIKRREPFMESLALSSRQRIFLATVMIGVLTGAFYVYVCMNMNPYNIRFYEICSDNDTIILNDDGLICDYVELYNAGKRTVKLGNLYLSDDEDYLKKMKVGDIKLSPGEAALIVLDDTTGAISISKHGETLFLSDGKGNIIDCIDVPKLPADVSYSYNLESASWGVYTCTPGELNIWAQRVAVATVEAPVFGSLSGFYDEDFLLNMEAGDDAVIYYTTDCRTPDENSNVYTEPILITNVCDEPNTWHSIKNLMIWDRNDWTENMDKCVVIKAVAVDSEGNRSAETVASYFVGMDEYKDKAVISLVPDYDALFAEGGIYTAGKDLNDVIFMHSGRETEREAFFEYFEGDDVYFSQNIGIRLFGATSRQGVEKRFTLYARKEYSGYGFMDFNFFGDGNKYKKLALRTGFSNMLAQELMSGTNVLTVDSVPVTLFLDGELYGDTYLQTKLCADFVSRKYGVDEENVILIKNGELEDGYEDELNLYLDLMGNISNTDYTDNRAYDELCDVVDIESYIEYACANLYLANMDYNELHNFAVWRTREKENSPYGDCRWRFIMYDLDSLDYDYIMLDEWHTENMSAIDSFISHAFTDEEYNFKNNSLIYSALRRNEDFAKRFLIIYSDMLNFEFAGDRVESMLEEYGETLDWNYGFFIDRTKYVLQHIAQEFELSGDTSVIEIDIENPDGGTVKVNTRTIEEGTAHWSGEYLVEVPMTLIAVPDEGYEFVGWSGDVTSSDAAIDVEFDKEVVSLNAIFKKID